MGKRYLNREEKTAALTIGAFMAYMGERAQEWAAFNRPKDLIKYAKTARTYGQKTLNELCTNLDPDDFDLLIKEVDKMQAVVRYNEEAAREYKDMQKMDTVTPVETDDLIAIVELGLVSCSVCETGGEEAADCRFKKVLLKYNMEPLNCNPGPDDCAYRFPRGGVPK